MIPNTFSKTVDLLHRAMDANQVRYNVIAHNISNAGTPNFKRQVVNYESELKRALETGEKRPVLELTLADPRHIPNWKERDYREVSIRRVLDYTSTYNNNGNNVDPEQEMAEQLRTQMTYTLLAQAQAFEFSQMSLVLRG
ncbi:MAG: flagellar basal body rod protein FlgB [Treponema sp.]|jgi:flagellar basal-body rod protein FlgB|nr:flagellar basal body rod protein FlgB [Treponema sp.]